MLRGLLRLTSCLQVQDFLLDRALTSGKESLAIELSAGPDGQFTDRDRGFHLLAPAWVEAGWWVLSIPPLLQLPGSV
jgi:hypothetical protein